MHSSSKDQANAFKDYFIQQSTLDNPNENTPDVEHSDSEITDIIPTFADVHYAIKHLDKSRATGPDMIYNELLILSLTLSRNP